MSTTMHDLPAVASLSPLYGELPKEAKALYDAARSAASVASEAREHFAALCEVNEQHLHNLDEEAGVAAALKGKPAPGAVNYNKWRTDHANAYADAESRTRTANGLIESANSAYQKAAGEMRRALLAPVPERAQAVADDLGAAREGMVSLQQVLNSANGLARIEVGPDREAHKSLNPIDFDRGASAGVATAIEAMRSFTEGVIA